MEDPEQDQGPEIQREPQGRPTEAEIASQLEDPHGHRAHGVLSGDKLVPAWKARRIPNMRHRDWKPGLCRWCAGPCTGRRRTFCSDTCVAEYSFRCDSGYARAYVWARDHGICQLCGCDLAKIQRLATILRLDHDRVDFYSHHERRYKSYKEGSRELAYLTAAGFSPSPNKALWEADHILPITEGGGFCGPGNLRTLCQVCHSAETAVLKERLKARKATTCKPSSRPRRTGA